MILNYCNWSRLIKTFSIFKIIILLILSTSVYADFFQDTTLEETDVKLYKEIFQIQSLPIKNKNAKEWKKIKLLKSKISNPILFGTISAEKFLHPTGWRSSFKELKNWLKAYSDHPDAYKIYRLAKRRKPKKEPLPVRPSGDYLNGYGNILKDLVKPVFPLLKNHKYKRESFSISIKVRRAINRKNVKYAEELLSSQNVKRKLKIIEIAQLRAELAHAYFIFKQDHKSIRQARISTSLSNHKNALALWAGGLASWRLGEYDSSKWFFNNLAMLEKGPESIISGGNYWSAKLAFELGKTNEINKYLLRAIKYDRTFYSTLSKAMLGYKDNFNFELKKIPKRFYTKLSKFAGGKRILALIQVNQYHKASREFRKIIFNFDKQEYPEIISFAQKNNMPGFAFRISAILRNDYNKILLGGLYPVPNWDVKSLEIKDKPLLLSISRQESGFNPRAKSYANALGLMQVLPSTAAFIMKNKKYKNKKNLLYDEDTNLFIASKYIKFLFSLNNVDKNLIKMLASYNAGPGNFSKWSKNLHPKENDPVFMLETLPARQTRNYIKLVLTNLWVYRIRMNENPDFLFELANGKNPKYKF